MTSSGERVVCAAYPNDDFWRAWKNNNKGLIDLGIYPKKVKGRWQVRWWKPISAEEEERTIAESRAKDCDIEIPAPAGLSYLPFQKAGIYYINKRRNCFIADDMGLGLGSDQTLESDAFTSESWDEWSASPLELAQDEFVLPDSDANVFEDNSNAESQSEVEFKYDNFEFESEWTPLGVEDASDEDLSTEVETDESDVSIDD